MAKNGPAPKNEFVSISEAARLVGVSRQAIHYAIVRKKIKRHVRMRPMIRVRLSQVRKHFARTA